MSSAIEYWAPFFDLMGNKNRLKIMFILHASEYIPHDGEIIIHRDRACLKTRTIADASGIASLSYHLTMLEEGGLVKKFPALEKGRPILLWGVTEKWLSFAKDFNFDDTIKEYVNTRFEELSKTN